MLPATLVVSLWSAGSFELPQQREGYAAILEMHVAADSGGAFLSLWHFLQVHVVAAVSQRRTQ